ncbi:hypothetical protein Tco_0070472, partial [Tanacetum coccineum]
VSHIVDLDLFKLAKTAKKQKFDDKSTQPTEEKVEEDKDDKPTKKTGKRRKQIARKGLHTDLDKDDSKDSDKVSKKDDSTSDYDLTELYRIMMRKHSINEPEDEFEKVLWEYMKNMFEEPLSTDSIWSLLDVYMLIERKYPLSAKVCKAMLDKKLQGGKPDEDCYKLLKMMEKQASIRK